MKPVILFSGFLLLTLAWSSPAEAQFLKKLKKEIADRVEDKIIKDAGDAAVKGVDRTEKAVGDAAVGSQPDSKADVKNDPVSSGKVSNNGAGDASAKSGSNTSEIPGEGGMGEIGTNYDFKPGERILFETDFSETVVGNFPRNLEFRGGQLSVVSYSGGRAIKANTKGAFAIKFSEKLPERFTIEFKEFNAEYVNHMRVEIVDDKFNELGTHYIQIDGYDGAGAGVAAYKRENLSSLQVADIINKQMIPIRVMVDGSYVKVYVGKTRVANMPNANLGRSNTLLFNFTSVHSKPIYVADIRIAAGGRSLYQALEATGRVAIHDIHFATGKADILPESSETIEAVAKLLQDHADLKLLIEGHTDNTGDIEKNMQLSKDRAAAVKVYLVDKLKINENRLKTVGLGQSRPTATNDTEEGRAENRRVEIVKL